MSESKIIIEIPSELFTSDLYAIRIERSAAGHPYRSGFKLLYKKWWEFWK